MAEHVLKQILEKSGVTHAGEVRAETANMLQSQLAEIQNQYNAGRITRALALDATRSVMELALAETINDPHAYRIAMEAGHIDAARQAIGGWDDGLTDEAAAQKRRDAFNVVLANRADDFATGGGLSAEDYAWTLQQVDPGSITDARVRNGVNQVVGMDETPRDLDAQETTQLATTAFYKRKGMLGDWQPDEPNDAPPAESASDWSEQRLEKYFSLRAAEQEAARHPFETEEAEPVRGMPGAE
jgi:hypothetical protein